MEGRGGLKIWQWNAGGLGTKINSLKMILMDSKPPPDVLALQETDTNGSIPGYDRFDTEQGTTGKNICTFVRRDLAVKKHTVSMDGPTKLIVTEILPKRKKQQSLFICNMYSSPKDASAECAQVFKALNPLLVDNAAIVLGDFNAHHTIWGYGTDSVKGKAIVDAADRYNAVLLNDVTYPTRIGNSVQRNTTPDLAFSVNLEDVVWKNTQENSGSDHYIIEVQATLPGYTPRKARIQPCVDWDKFRRERENRVFTSIEEWSATVVEDAANATRQVENPTQAETIDSRLGNMLEAYYSLYNRWKSTGKRYSKLRKKASRLYKDIEDYAKQLNHQKWQQVCDEAQNMLHTKSPWHLFRKILAPENTKPETQKLLIKLMRDYVGNTEDLIADLYARYLDAPPEAGANDVSYSGNSNPLLDAPIKVHEIRRALAKLKVSSAPGEDKVNNRMLKNLDDNSVRCLTNYFNEIWTSGVIPKAFKHATVCFIPKPGKPLTIDNLRPISLTSCVGKVLEHIIQTRIQEYMEEHNLFTEHMFGFRKQLSTQDVLLQLKEGVHKQKWTALAALDLRKAFDRVSHVAILRQVSAHNLGERTFNYIKDFLQNRTAKIQLEGELTDELEVNKGRGTPQGSVISPLLFNLIMIPLSRKLQEVEGLKHAVYADDITLWTALPSPSRNNVINAGIKIVRQEAKEAGLECATDKSALLVRTSKNRKLRENEEFYIELQRMDIPRADQVKILGMIVSIEDRNREALTKLRKQADNVARLIRRTSKRSYGLKESGTCRLVHAFTLSRIMYAAPYMNLKKAEEDSLDVIIRRSFKAALGISQKTSNDGLDQMGIHNTFDEMRKAQRQVQIQRLSQTRTGRRVLQDIGVLLMDQEMQEKHSIRQEWTDTVRSIPLPKNMSSAHNSGRRLARAKALNKLHEGKVHIFHADAGPYPGRPGKFVIAVHNARQDSMATISAKSIEEAEEAAIALARVQAARRGEMYAIVTSDSKKAITNTSLGRVGLAAYKLYARTQISKEANHTLTWVPGHSGHTGNETAHMLVVRGLHLRTTGRMGLPTTHGDHNYSASTNTIGPAGYGEILERLRLRRQTLAAPHKKLSRLQESAWRRLQLRNNTTPHILKRSWPDLFSGKCEDCGNQEEGTWRHVYWECPTNPLPATLRVEDGLPVWETLLVAEDIGTQLEVISRAQKIEDKWKKRLCMRQSHTPNPSNP